MATKYDTVEACHTRKDTRLTLKYVNRLRAQLGLKPVKHLAAGITGDVVQCSIALTLTTKYTQPVEVAGGGIIVNRYSRLRGNRTGDVIQTLSVKPPKYVADWIESFDSGNMPGLIAERK